MIQSTYSYALNDMEKNSPVDYKLQVAVISAKNLLTKLLSQMKKAQHHYGEMNNAINNDTAMFPDPKELWDVHLKEHEQLFSEYANGRQQSMYGEAKRLLER